MSDLCDHVPDEPPRLVSYELTRGSVSDWRDEVWAKLPEVEEKLDLNDEIKKIDTSREIPHYNDLRPDEPPPPAVRFDAV